ncbi:MAG TPA: response regulator, partial [Longimicrobiales bacterium]|nr:response regulator [Longimicrobiales bacterium]
RRPDGVSARTRVSLRRLPGPDADPWIVMVLDLAGAESQPAAEARQVQKMEAVGRLAGGIAHDFNNLLTAIQGHAQLLLDDMPPGAAGRADLEEILAAGERATTLTRQLLTFTRRQQVDPREIDVNAVVLNLQNMLRRLIPEHIDLSFDLDPAVPQVLADVGQLEQVLLNLVINGRDAIAGGGFLAIRTAVLDLRHEYAGRGGSIPAGRYVQIAVSDSGVGMTRDVQERIFEPFFTTKPVGKGTGLGLATVADVVRQYDGHLNVYTEPGRGTIFKVFLPAAGPAIADEPAPTDRGSESVLIVEDDPVVRALASRTLRGRGYHVLDADRGDDALTMADESGGVDIVVTDIVVPGMSGRKLAERVRQRYPRTRVLYTSGFAVQDAVRQGLADRDANYLEKPFSPDRLARTVRETLDRSE